MQGVLFSDNAVLPALSTFVSVSVQLAFQHVSSAARTTKLVQKVAEEEIENTEDPTFKADLTAAKDRVAQCEPPSHLRDSHPTLSVKIASHYTFGHKRVYIIIATFSYDYK